MLPLRQPPEHCLNVAFREKCLNGFGEEINQFMCHDTFDGLLRDERSVNGRQVALGNLLEQKHSVEVDPLQNAELVEAANDRIVLAELYTFESLCRELQ